MGKITTYIIVMSGIMLLFYFGGLLQDCTGSLCEGETPNSLLLNQLLKPQDMPKLSLRDKIILAIEGIAVVAGAIAIGILTHSLESAVLAPVAVYLFNLMWDFLFVFNKVRSANPVLAVLFFSPFLIYFIVAILDWWRGRD